ncbi:MAG: hypothetical protein QOE26_2447, partial [Verrucomicrobiota bacterium]
MSYPTRVIVAVALLIASGGNAFAIREFDIRTIEALGRNIYEKARQASSSQSELERRAIRTASDALKGINLRGYRFVVLTDPKRSGLLVYALATSANRDEIVAGVHYRLTVSADGRRAEQVDALSRTRVVITSHSLPSKYNLVGFVLGQIVSDKPVETFVYLTLLHKKPCMIATPDGSVWWIENGKIRKEKKKATDRTASP